MADNRGTAATREVKDSRSHKFFTCILGSEFIGLNSPEHVEWCRQIRQIPFKRIARSLITYLEKNEMDALLNAPDRSTEQGRRDYAILLFLYNTGARADEAAQLKIKDLDIAYNAKRIFPSY